jgi:hypothetical protein
MLRERVQLEEMVMVGGPGGANMAASRLCEPRRLAQVMRFNGLEDEEDGIRGMQKYFASDSL